MNSVLIRQGRILDSTQRWDEVADLLIKNGKIAEKAPSLPSIEGVPEINARGLVVTAGWIDVHTHLREPGGSQKETVTTGTAAAAAGGFTSIACMANTNPVNDNSFVTSYLQQKIKEEALVNVYIIGAVTRGLKGEELAEIGSMAESGIVGLSDDGKTVMNSYLLRKALDYSKRFNLPVISHAEDCSLKGRGVMNEGFNSARFGLRGIPAASETLIVSRDLLLAELTGARVHIAHVSTEGSVRLIREAKRRGLQITAEVTPHHITLTDEACGTYDTNTKVAPPLRGPEDREALSEALADGTIDVVASDHAPHSVEDKQIEYDLAEFGMVGLETAFPLYHRQVLKKRFSLERLMEAMTIGPAKILGLEKNKGSLVVGKDGDVTLWNPETVFKVNKSEFRSKSKNTPFDGWQLQGQVVATIVGGRIVFSRLASDRPGGAQ